MTEFSSFVPEFFDRLTEHSGTQQRSFLGVPISTVGYDNLYHLCSNKTSRRQKQTEAIENVMKVRIQEEAFAPHASCNFTTVPPSSP